MLRCSLQVSKPIGVVRRPCADGEETLVLSRGPHDLACNFMRIVDADKLVNFSLSPALHLYERDAEGLRPYANTTLPVASPAYDPYTGMVYFKDGHAIMQMDENNVVSLLAGDAEGGGVEDGDGAEARFHEVNVLVPDGTGAMYVGDDGQLRRVQLHRPPEQPQQQDAGDLRVEAAPARVSTVLEVNRPIRGLAYEHGRGTLLLAVEDAVYRVTPSTGPDQPAILTLIAGAAHDPGDGDGPALDARFREIGGMVTDREGSAYIVDWDRRNRGRVRRLSREGDVSTLATRISEGVAVDPFILPNGCLATCRYSNDCVELLYLGLTPMALQRPGGAAGNQGAAGPGAAAAEGGAAAAEGGAPQHPVLAALGSLLDAAQADPGAADADVSITVAGRAFHGHRAILRARCDYFKQLFGSDFAESASRTVELADADPDTFGALLRYIYTGCSDLPPNLLRPLAELADRLLLPDLCAEAQAQVLAAAAPEGVVGDMLWAEGRGFTGLLAGLKAYYGDHHEKVLSEARGSVKRLMSENPDLMLELHETAVKRARRGSVGQAGGARGGAAGS